MKDEPLFINLLDLMMEMSDADMSVLIATAGDHRNGLMTTIVGSQNYVLWRELTKIGLLKEEQSPQIDRLEEMRVFSINPDSMPRLEKLLGFPTSKRSQENDGNI